MSVTVDLKIKNDRKTGSHLFGRVGKKQHNRYSVQATGTDWVKSFEYLRHKNAENDVFYNNIMF